MGGLTGSGSSGQDVVNKIKKSLLWAGRHASVGEESGHTLSESFGQAHLGEK